MNRLFYDAETWGAGGEIPEALKELIKKGEAGFHAGTASSPLGNFTIGIIYAYRHASELAIETKLRAQLELVSGYISKIDMNGWTIEDVRDSLSKDYQYLQQEFGLLQANKAIGGYNESIPSAEPDRPKMRCAKHHTIYRYGTLCPECLKKTVPAEPVKEAQPDAFFASPSLPGEQVANPILKLSEWLNRELIWQDSHARTTKTEFHKGALQAYEAVAAEIMKITAPSKEDPDDSAAYEKWLDQPGLEKGEQVKANQLAGGVWKDVMGERIAYLIKAEKNALIDIDGVPVGSHARQVTWNFIHELGYRKNELQDAVKKIEFALSAPPAPSVEADQQVPESNIEIRRPTETQKFLEIELGRANLEIAALKASGQSAEQQWKRELEDVKAERDELAVDFAEAVCYYYELVGGKPGENLLFQHVDSQAKFTTKELLNKFTNKE